MAIGIAILLSVRLCLDGLMWTWHTHTKFTGCLPRTRCFLGEGTLSLQLSFFSSSFDVPPDSLYEAMEGNSSVHLCDEPTACPFVSPSFQRHKHWKGQKEGRIIPPSAHQNKKKKRVGSIFNYFCTPKSSTKTVKYSTKWDRDGYAASRNVYVFLIDVCLHTNVLSLFLYMVYSSIGALLYCWGTLQQATYDSHTFTH